MFRHDMHATVLGRSKWTTTMHPHVSSQACQPERIAKAQREVSIDTQEIQLQSQAATTGIANNQSQWTRFACFLTQVRSYSCQGTSYYKWSCCWHYVLFVVFCQWFGSKWIESNWPVFPQFCGGYLTGFLSVSIQAPPESLYWYI